MRVVLGAVTVLFVVVVVVVIIVAVVARVLSVNVPAATAIASAPGRLPCTDAASAGGLNAGAPGCRDTVATVIALAPLAPPPRPPWLAPTAETEATVGSEGCGLAP